MVDHPAIEHRPGRVVVFDVGRDGADIAAALVATMEGGDGVYQQLTQRLQRLEMKIIRPSGR